MTTGDDGSLNVSLMFQYSEIKYNYSSAQNNILPHVSSFEYKAIAIEFSLAELSK